LDYYISPIGINMCFKSRLGLISWLAFWFQ